MSTDKRKKVLVHHKIQGALIKTLVLQWLMFISFTGLAMVVMQLWMDPFQSSVEWNYHLRITILSLAIVSVCLLPVFILDLIKLSNRFVGPIVRLQSYVDQVGRGEVGELRFRKHDFWVSLADDFNAMLKRIQQESEQESESSDEEEPETVSAT